jgi:FkbM family methyltransferase
MVRRAHSSIRFAPSSLALVLALALECKFNFDQILQKGFFIVFTFRFMKYSLYRIANFILLFFRSWNPLLAFRLSRYKVHTDFRISFITRYSGLLFPDQTLFLTTATMKKWDYNLMEICRLARNKYLLSVRECEDDILISMCINKVPIQLYCNSLDNLIVLNELFTDNIYDFDFGNKMLAIDVGMNVGYASLLFAARPDIAIVYGFEPFTGTFNCALRNFELNPKLSAKIQPINAGWSNQSGTFEFRNYPTGSIDASTSFTEQFVVSAIHGDYTPAHLLHASEALENILQLHPGQNIFLKMDCEGSEYDILDTLASDNVLSHFDKILLEWHENGPEKLTSILKRNGFGYFSTGRPDLASVGFIYAFRNKGVR